MAIYSYMRFSSHGKQARGDSIRRQTALRVAYLKRHPDLVLDDSLRPDEGKSAYHGRHAAEGHLGDFLEKIRRGQITKGSILIIENLDRLSRQQVGLALSQFIGILNSGIRIVTLDPEKEYTQQSINDVAGLLEPIIVMQRAWEESERKSHRGRAAWDDKRDKIAEKKLTGRVPAWLRLTKDKTGFDILPDKLGTVRLIFQLSLQGMGVGVIAKKFNAEKVPAIGRVGYWQSSYIKKLLKSRAVLGEYVPHVLVEGRRQPLDKPIPDYYPRIISDADYYRVQQSLVGRTEQRGPIGKAVTNLFTGLVKDARDGSHLRYVDKGKRSGGPFLVSAAAVNGQAGSRYMPFPYSVFEAAFLAHAQELKPSDFVVGVDHVDDLGVLSGKLAEVEQKIESVSRRVREEAGFEVLIQLLSELEADRRTIKESIEKTKVVHANHRVEALGELQSLAGILADSEGQDRYELRAKMRGRLKALVTEIWFIAFDHPGMKPRIAEAQVHYWDGQIRQISMISDGSLAASLDPGLFRAGVMPTSDLRNYRDAAFGGWYESGYPIYP